MGEWIQGLDFSRHWPPQPGILVQDIIHIPVQWPGCCIGWQILFFSFYLASQFYVIPVNHCLPETLSASGFPWPHIPLIFFLLKLVLLSQPAFIWWHVSRFNLQPSSLFNSHTLLVVFSGPNALNLSMVMMSSLLSPALNSPLSPTFLYSTAYVASRLRHLIHITSNIAWIKHNSSFTPQPNLCLSYGSHLRKWHIIDAVIGSKT